MGNTILKMEHISKYIFDAYGKPIRGSDVKILDDVQFDVREAEVHILVGENGAGKSTLMKILGGIISQDEGTVELFGKQVCFTNPKESQEMGIGFVHQELNLCANLTVAQNLFLGRETGGRILTNTKEMAAKSTEMLAKLGFSINPNTLVRDLSTAQQQIIEIVKAVSYDSRIIIMDEPTACLTQKEIDHLFEIIRTMQKQGISVIYISHRFEELKEIGDRLTVLRDGKYVGTIEMEDFSYDKVIHMMVGRTLGEMYKCAHVSSDEVVLEIRDLKIDDNTEPLSLKVHKGEVVGIGGLVGSGRTELAKSIFGVRRFYGGQILYKGEAVARSSPSNMIRRGLVYLTEDRKVEGLVLPMDLVCNTTLASLMRLFPGTRINRRREGEVTEETIDSLNIACSSRYQLANTLSGGNQQKVSLAKWLICKPDVLILDEPTRGIDVNAKSEIYKIIDKLASSGAAILMISSEMPELIGMSDRIYVMRRGTISASLTERADFTQEKILSYTV
ncbi:ribose import ATP-binding protein RbsA [Spirochaetia bacterium]|nr:ribose import ATP-binding protein RbsA [Spirochaetia bacterium]